MNDWFEAEQRVERAQQLSESQRWEEALTELDAALAINPNNATWHAHRGYLLEELDRWEEAVGPEIAAHCRPVSLRDGRLEVSVDSSVWCQQLQLQVPQILGALRQVFGDEAPTQLWFRVGSGT